MRNTCWNVITGAPCSGKTSVISELARLDYRVVQETARAYIDEELKRGRDLSQIKADPLLFERKILNRKIEIETALPDSEIIFLDRAIPDSIAYFELEGLDPEVPRSKSSDIRYASVFMLNRLRFVTDRVRTEDDRMAATLDRLLETSYVDLGYPVVRVPVLSVKKRCRFILDIVQGR
jgi:predicted ATPase